ncbi:unnamed protein product [Dibothriocephalus latus]|uniref:MARVEL domain-containing protein n=1 Tax=Dibothriocephalus latus TaxID=60516 RepID=A0A3P6Q492_DIBLA|nr:unnamed protein product [Dibothriocephalus latus]
MEKSDIQPVVHIGFSILFLSLALALPYWPCGTILTSCMNSPRSNAYLVVGALLASALALELVAILLAVISCASSLKNLSLPSFILNCIASILVLAAVSYYYARLDNTYSPMMAVIGMTYARAKLLLKW